MDRMKMRQPEADMFHRRNPRNMPNHQDINNTPIRLRENNKENSLFPTNRNKEIIKPVEVKQQSPSSDSTSSMATSKTVLKKRISPQNSLSKVCVNHMESEAEFRIIIDGDLLNYCSKCAAHLASNGFQVERITQSRSPIRGKETRSPHSRRRQELTTFLASLRQLERGYTEKVEQSKRVQESYVIEKETIVNFYASMTEYLQFLRDEHLHFLDDEEEHHTQICEIEAAEMGETLEEIVAMREDIECNVNKIVEEVEAESYTECMAYYSQKRGLHEHRLEELGVDGREASLTSAQVVDDKLNEFKEFIDQLTGIRNSKAESCDY